MEPFEKIGCNNFYHQPIKNIFSISKHKLIYKFLMQFILIIIIELYIGRFVFVTNWHCIVAISIIVDLIY